MRGITIKEVLTTSILGLILLVLITANIYLFLYDENFSISFSDLFQKIQDMPRIDTSFIQLNFESGINADWGVFNFAKDFLNGIWQIVGLALFVCVQIINCCVYLFQLVRILFVGVLG